MLNQIRVLPIRERVASEIRNAIFSGKFKSGYELRQDFLANELGVSRMPVREALYILAGEGLIELRTNKGAIVKEISTKYIQEHFEVRLILECEAVTKACQNNSDLAGLELIHKEQKKAIEDLNFNETSLLNQAFHMFIWDLADNSKMKSIMEQLWNGLAIGPVIVPIVHAKKSYKEHNIIINAIKNNDTELARETMRKHIIRSMENMLMRAP